MQNVGMITFHGSHNYGSVLQAYALSMQLKNMGYMPEIINLRNQAQLDAYKVFQVKGTGLKKIIHFLYATVNYPAMRHRAKEFERFINHVLPVTKKEFSCGEELRESTDYDIYLTGSDQVWNPACQDFESAYYLDFVSNGAKRIAYAPSLGKAEFSEEHKQLIATLLKNIDFVSCREEEGVSLLRTLTDKSVVQVCDPVVLLGREKWVQFAKEPKIKKPYILTYFLENNHGGKQYLKELQEKLGYQVICLNEDIRDIGKGYKHKIGTSPEEFVGLFKNAAFVYTNSFHGTAFSTIFNRPFLTIIGKQDEANNNDSRKINYLKMLGLEDRILTDKVPEDLFAIDWEEANCRMSVVQATSFEYLQNALEK